MRKLYILSGAPASGKTGFIRQHGLEPYTLSADLFRQLYANPVRRPDGTEMISQEVSSHAWKKLYEALEYRMAVGETTIVDATHLTPRSLEPYKALAKKYSYKVHLVRFGRDLSLEELLARDAARGLNMAGEPTVRKMYARMESLDGTLSKRWNPLTPDEFLASLDWKVRDISNYAKVKVIGDVHSCATALDQALADFNAETLYVFVGDYFDRGTEPVAVMEKLLWLVKQPNVVLLVGNHERHIYDFLAGLPVKSPAFKETLAEIMRAGYTKADFARIVKQMQPVYAARFHGFEMVMTHSGLTPGQFGKSLDDYCHRLALRNEAEFMKGLGDYDYPIVEEWIAADLDVFQFYGHRNTRGYEVISDGNAFCLEQKVEFGGRLAVTVTEMVDPDCIVTGDESVQNTVFNSELSAGRGRLTLAKIRKHSMVRTKPLGNGVSVLNFTRDAFFKRVWDNETVTARGLFVNDKDEVVARGYNKFFYLGERPETQLDVVVKFIKGVGGTMTEQDKENGFLAIAAYIPELGGLRVFSKGAGEYHSELARELIASACSWDSLEAKLKADYEAGIKYSLTFEVCDVDRDPHIVFYDRPRVFLLDTIANDLAGKMLDDKTAEIADEFGFDRPVIRTVDVDAMTEAELREHLITLEERTRNNEGLVVTFGDSQKLKVKSDWYNRRKKLRGMSVPVLNAGPESYAKYLDSLRKSAPEYVPAVEKLRELHEAGLVTATQTETGRLELNVPVTLEQHPELQELLG